jgi:hypothetical protein
MDGRRRLNQEMQNGLYGGDEMFLVMRDQLCLEKRNYAGKSRCELRDGSTRGWSNSQGTGDIDLCRYSSWYLHGVNYSKGHELRDLLGSTAW